MDLTTEITDINISSTTTNKLVYKPKSDLLKNKNILITGASCGIGYEVAKEYAKYGANIILLARNIKLLSKLYDEIKENKYPEPIICPFNLATANADDYCNLNISLSRKFKQLDGILLNAGTINGLTPIKDYQVENWYHILQVNLNSNFLLTKSLMPLLKKSNNSSIIFTTSNIAKNPKAYWGAYAVASSGNQTLMQVLADECEEHTNIRVNSIMPDKIKTKFRKNIYPAENPAELTNPKDITKAYLYLMGNDSEKINRHTIIPVKEFIPPL